MSLEFRIKSRVSPSGVNLAHVEIPPLDASRNISIIDHSYKWEENVANIDVGVVGAYVSETGYLPKMTVTDFVVTNETTESRQDMDSAPLYYRHMCRFYHYSFGDNPTKHVYVTDKKNNILKGINYKVRARRVTRNIFRIEILTDFQNNEYEQYKVRYNRCDSSGENIYPSWSEVLNATPLFVEGAPSTNMYEYALIGPDDNGLYQVDVPPVPVLSDLKNSVGISFTLAPTLIEGDPGSVDTHTSTVEYTLKAIGVSQFIVSRNSDPQGYTTTDIYLQSETGDTWGSSQVAFDIGTTLTFDGISVDVGDSNYLNVNDQAYFTAGPSYYYLKPIKFRAIYLEKPDNVDGDDDWYVKIKAGSFTRRMDENGEVVPSGFGTRYQYYISEYDENPWSMVYGRPNVEVKYETPKFFDTNVIKLKHSPMFIEPSDVFYNDGYPPSGYITVRLNGEQLDETEIVDWDVYNSAIKVARTLTGTEDITVDYVFREDYYEYQGFFGSGYYDGGQSDTMWHSLNLNPTPMFNQGMYASGVTAHIFVGPSWDLDSEIFFNQYPCYHNYDGEPSGVLDFYLGSVSLAPHIKETDIALIDTRTRGGGVKPTVDLDMVREEQPESDFFWDIGYFDGKAFPSNGVIVIQLPKRLQGREDEIREKVNRHLAFGEYAIIDFI